MIDINKIYNEDCLEGMKRIDDKSVDIILCDLPFGTTMNAWDIVIPFEPLWEQYERIIKDNGSILLMGMQPFTTDLINSNRSLFRYDLIWYKALGSGFLNAKRQPMRNHEHICVFYKSQPTYNPILTIGVRKRGKRLQTTNGDNYGKFTMKEENRKYDNGGLNMPQSVIDISNGDRTKESQHPTQKPLDLFDYLITMYSNEGYLVLDNCMGSGTTAIASLKTKRNFIGFEKEKKYFDIANKRIEEQKKIQTLF